MWFERQRFEIEIFPLSLDGRKDHNLFGHPYPIPAEAEVGMGQRLNRQGSIDKEN